MSTIKNLAIEKTTANDSDYLAAQDPSSNATYKITKQNLLTGLGGGGGGGGGFLIPSNVLIANYQNDFLDLKSHAPTIIGNPLISTAKSPYPNGKSLYLDNGSYLTYSHNTDFTLNADWMIELFVWLPLVYATNNIYAGILQIRDTNCYIVIGLLRSEYNNNGIYKQFYTQAYNNSQNLNLTCYSLNPATFAAWNHLALLQLGNAWYFFLNETYQSGIAFPTKPKFTDSPVTISVGYRDVIPSLYDSYIAGLRIRTTGIKTPTVPFTLLD